MLTQYAATRPDAAVQTAIWSPVFPVLVMAMANRLTAISFFDEDCSREELVEEDIIKNVGIDCISWDPSGAHVAAGSRDGVVRVFRYRRSKWEDMSLSFVEMFQWDFKVSLNRSILSWDGTGTHLAVGIALSNLVSFLNPIAGAEASSWETPSHCEIRCIDWKTDESRSWLAIAAGGRVIIFDLVAHSQISVWPQCRLLWSAHYSDEGCFGKITSETLKKICSFLVLRR
eukprot:gnl/TRDRNA2_/TRDRNA2_140745_c1_seq2.p1 gnl/TRDRNA2_/TRDRNA2_140745_c1~~gnl/TRDRNA2_/TRDRNA2_140745_c1_seq2.p1  ORF type:complete len:229 (-),score=12.26 gnl/TRDRNA2_/TRDRNA2_140745_c1_seq2:72-758(-)